jgi:hypothetical protein
MIITDACSKEDLKQTFERSKWHSRCRFKILRLYAVDNLRFTFAFLEDCIYKVAVNKQYLNLEI